ncbi:uncharacterized protein [Nicotiana sylvestris]|uniref:uncharacterized protein n=1 Tax=Nicotiana sylvestris TaxID=4096 RepID=UPI00388C343D
MAGGSTSDLHNCVQRLEALIGVTDYPLDLADLITEIYRLKMEWISFMKALAAPGQGSEERSEVKILDPKTFGGAHSAKELENFLWDMEQYFVAAKVSNGEKVPITSMYLTEDAKLWWRTCMADDESASRPKIDTWEKLRKKMKDQFLPSNASWLVGDRVKRLRQTGTTRYYIKEFTSLMLDIQNMSEDDKLHNFISGMQAWELNELRRQNVKDLPSEIATSDSLKKVEKKGEWRKEVQKEVVEKGKVVDGSARNKGIATKKCDGCWTCGGPHIAKNCPNRERVNALLATENNWDGVGQEVVVALVNPLQLLNVISLVNATSNETNPHSLLMHIEMKIGEKGMIAMVDTGATHTFVSSSLVHKYGLSVSKYPSYMKTVNAKAQAIVGMAYNIPMSIGNWKGKVNLMVISLEDFEVILGIDFMRKNRFVPMPHLDRVMIMHETAPGFVKVVHPYGKEKTQRRASLVLP